MNPVSDEHGFGWAPNTEMRLVMKRFSTASSAGPRSIGGVTVPTAPMSTVHLPKARPEKRWVALAWSGSSLCRSRSSDVVPEAADASAVPTSLPVASFTVMS